MKIHVNTCKYMKIHVNTFTGIEIDLPNPNHDVFSCIFMYLHVFSCFFLDLELLKNKIYIFFPLCIPMYSYVFLCF